jgi:hypothetical protein
MAQNLSTQISQQHQGERSRQEGGKSRIFSDDNDPGIVSSSVTGKGGVTARIVL